MPRQVMSWTSPTQLLIGEGLAQRYLSTLDDVLLVRDPHVRGLSAQHVVVREPQMGDRDLIRVVQEARARRPDATVVAVGGGSVLDPSRLAVHGWDGPTPDGVSFIPADVRSSCDLVCIPSTIGTAAEVSPTAVLRDQDRLALIVSPALRARTAILDPSISDRADDSWLGAGLVEPWARAVVPALAGEPLLLQDRIAGAVASTLLDLATTPVDARWRLTAALASAQTHTSFLALQRSPFSHVLWPIVTECSLVCGASKHDVLAALLPVWITGIDASRVGEVLGAGPGEVASRLRSAWPPPLLTADAGLVADRVHRRWSPFNPPPASDIVALIAAAAG